MLVRNVIVELYIETYKPFMNQELYSFSLTICLDIYLSIALQMNWITMELTKYTNTFNAAVSNMHSNAQHCISYFSEVLQDVIEDDLLGLIGVHSGERVHIDDSILKADQRKTQGAFKSLR